jgi:uncharacterized protein YdhG (YjbR/CyaY superfamily)
MAQQFESVEDYIGSFPPEVQTVLQSTRQTIHTAAPGLEESISYGIPTFSSAGQPLVYLGGWKKHLSIYPIPELDETLGPRLAPYISGKGTVKFPLARPIPHELITLLVQRLAEERRSGG